MTDHKRRNRALAFGTAAAAAVGAAAVYAERAFVRHDRARPDADAGEPFGSSRGDVIENVVSADGTRLHVEEWGSGPTIVLAHGYCLNLTLWHYQIADLARDYHVVAYDQRGHGRSGSPAEGGRWTLEALAEDLDAVLRVAGGGPAVVMGHSMGGMASITFARDFPEAIGSRVAALVLVDTTAADVMHGMVPGVGRYVQATLNGLEEVTMRVLAGSVDRVDRMRGRVSNAAYLGARFLGFGPNPSPSKVAYLDRVLAEAPTDVVLGFIPAMTGMDITHVLPRLDIPALVAVGAHDRLTPPGASKRLADAIKQAELFVIEDAGHMAMFEKPKEFNARVRRFLDRVPGWA